MTIAIDDPTFSPDDFAAGASAADAVVFRWQAHNDRFTIGAHLDQVLGIEIGTLSGLRSELSDRTHPRDRNDLDDVFHHAVMKLGERFCASVRLQHKDGSYRCFEMAGQFVGSGRDAGAIGLMRDITRERRTAERAAINGLSDMLTSLPTRALLEDRIDTILPLGQSDIALALIHVDGISAARELCSLVVEDAVIMTTARRITGCDLGAHTIARMGDASFAAFFLDAPNADALERKLQAVVRRVCSPITIAERAIVLECCIGIASDPHGQATRDMLFNHARNAVAAARKDGGNCVRIKTIASAMADA